MDSFGSALCLQSTATCPCTDPYESSQRSVLRLFFVDLHLIFVFLAFSGPSIQNSLTSCVNGVRSVAVRNHPFLNLTFLRFSVISQTMYRADVNFRASRRFTPGRGLQCHSRCGLGQFGPSIAVTCRLGPVGFSRVPLSHADIREDSRDFLSHVDSLLFRFVYSHIDLGQSNTKPENFTISGLIFNTNRFEDRIFEDWRMISFSSGVVINTKVWWRCCCYCQWHYWQQQQK